MRKLEKEKIAKSVGVDVLGDPQNKIANKNVGVDDPVRPNSRGITLIALIITIIVMLILVAVTITVALDSGLFGTGKKVAYQTEVREVQEQLEIAKAVKTADNGGKKPSDFGITINDLPISDELKTKYGSKLVISKDGTLYYDPAVVTDEEERTWLEEIGINEYAGETAGTFEKYILGENLEGRQLTEILDMSTWTFIDDEKTTDVDETQTLGARLLIAGPNGDNTKGYAFVEYEDVAYKFEFDMTTMETANLVEAYTKEGREGKDLGVETGDSQYNGWTIIYDNGDGTVEAVAPTAMGSLTLGNGDETAQTPGDVDGNGTPNENIDKAIYSYNNAITRINDYCKNLEGLPTNIGVRSVGATTDPIPNLEGNNAYRGMPSDWSTSTTYNGKGKIGDESWTEDLLRISYFDKSAIGSEYWVASRYVSAYSSGVSFNVAHVYSAGLFSSNNLWYVSSSGTNIDSPSCAVRPIITVQIP